MNSLSRKSKEQKGRRGGPSGTYYEVVGIYCLALGLCTVDCSSAEGIMAQESGIICSQKAQAGCRNWHSTNFLGPKPPFLSLNLA